MADFFKILATQQDCKARAGVIKLDNLQINTPFFMPVGTQGAVKAIDHKTIKRIGFEVILSNAYHLYLRPGLEVLTEFGGLHNFMNWDGGILTDSGGYQIYSLKELRKLTDDGVHFSSHIDGSKHFLTPEKVIDIQRIIGSDFMMILDECLDYPSDFQAAKRAADLSFNWAERSINYFRATQNDYKKQFIFAICQGGMFPELRTEYISKIINLDFDSFAIGGLSVGEPAEMMYEIVDISTNFLPYNKLRYLMGVGTPENILEAIDLGIDMFDCVLPTRNARNGQLFTTNGKINIRNAKYKFSKEPIDEALDSEISQYYTLGYLRHLFLSKEILALQIATHQNLAFYHWLLKTAREKILDGSYRQWKNYILNKLNNFIE
ncbi:MAG: tRNA guanosine(34) transglycosylase Tgt [Candidatus Kapabacteria bacterium]|nr:tRNA guanosine(34) transglycosylase Tgt [Candidatus Kapabacteria bacterium]